MSRARWMQLPGARGPSAPPRLARTTLRFLGELAAALALIAAFVAALLTAGRAFLDWAAADLARDPAAVQTPGLAACPPPTEHEQLQITVTWRAGQLAGDCRYVGPRGAYVRSRTGGPEVRP